MEKGRIVKAISGFFYVQSGEKVFSCKGRGILKKNELTPLVGDLVFFSITNKEQNEGILEDLIPRNSELVRPPVANVDQLLIVFSYTQPTPNYVLLDRILVTAESQHLQSIICFNKTDLLAKEIDSSLMEAYKEMGYVVIETSAITSDGLESLKRALEGRTTALAGSSGVGKSTLINSMFPQFSLETGVISKRIQRGKHTTRHSELHQINDDTWIMDTPGFSSLSITGMDDSELRDYFKDFTEIQLSCRFKTCLHLEEPGCAVKKAVQDGFIHVNRYQNYVNLLGEIRKNRRY